MKLIIWWCALMVILPFVYLFWWKKRWRVLWGVIILAVLMVGYILPGEYAHSLLVAETDKEKPVQQLKNALKDISDVEPNPNDSEKQKLEKSIVKLQREIQEDCQKLPKEKGEKWDEEWLKIMKKEWFKRGLIEAWVKKWGQKENTRTLLFCGEEFNKQLAESRGNLRATKEYNIIDFGLTEKTENNNPEFLQKKVAEICANEKNDKKKKKGKSPIIWLKNIDKITNPELENELVKIIDPKQHTNLGKQQVERKLSPLFEEKIPVEEIIDLSQFTLVATTSTSNPKLSEKIKAELNPIESFFDKYCWIIFGVSTTLEIIVLLWLTRSRKKAKKIA